MPGNVTTIRLLNREHSELVKEDIMATTPTQTKKHTFDTVRSAFCEELAAYDVSPPSPRLVDLLIGCEEILAAE
jgi:hypothetical protein